MNATLIDWSFLSRALWIGLASLIFSILLIWGSLEYMNWIEESFHMIHERYYALQGRQRKFEEQSMLLEKALPRFEALRRKGVIGAEPRVKWLETIQQAEATLKLPGPIQFKLNPPQHIKPANATLSRQSYPLWTSRMELGLGLLHEGDLMAFFDFLDRADTGIVQPRQCKLHRVRTPGLELESGGLAVHVEASCLLDWMTLREPAGEPR
ncbi:MAG: hypothetical protein HQL56_10890 [Magnetococcales bacterium]|nr:hypothetical protein [Magnetococcales bacterium]